MLTEVFLLLLPLAILQPLLVLQSLNVSSLKNGADRKT